MISLAYELQSLRRDLVRGLSLLRSASRETREVVLLACCTIPRVDLLAWLAAQESTPKFYWRSPGERFEAAGVGELYCLKDKAGSSDVFSDILDLVNKHPQGRLFTFFGGSGFAELPHLAPIKNNYDQEISQGSAFYQPEVVLLRSGERYSLIVGGRVALSAPDSAVLAQFQQKVASVYPPSFAASESRERPRLLLRRDQPDKVRWIEAVNAALAEISSGALGKVVLARRTDFTFSSKLPVHEVLRRAVNRHPRNYAFHLDFGEGPSFSSFSPECLLKLSGSSLGSDALGGTILGANGFGAFGQLERAKLSLEHDFVVEYLKNAYASLTESYRADEEPKIMGQPGLSHLHTRFSGTLLPGLGLSEAFSKIHPTPAVCGLPKAEALRFIAEHEPFARGWYAGPVGMVSRACTELAVGIRSFLCHGSQVSLFSGAGISKGSVAADEWRELDAKIESLEQILAPSQPGSDLAHPPHASLHTNKSTPKPLRQEI